MMSLGRQNKLKMNMEQMHKFEDFLLFFNFPMFLDVMKMKNLAHLIIMPGHDNVLCKKPETFFSGLFRSKDEWRFPSGIIYYQILKNV